MECAKKVSQDVEQFMSEAQLNEAFLFGGAVLDPLTRENAKVSDYDICIKDKDTFFETLKNLENKGCDISDVMRTHNIYVVIKHQELGQIDFSCMDPEHNGIFNIEKIYAKFRKVEQGEYVNKVVDKYGAIDAIKQGKLRLACNPADEGAYNILRRFLAITGKYNIDISVGGPNQGVIDDIKNEFQIVEHYIAQDKVRCLARLSASVRRSEMREEYVTNLGKQHIFAKAFPEIDKLFNNPEFQKSEELVNCKTQKEILELMLSHTKGVDRDDMIDCLSILSRREAARQDKGVKVFLENTENERTSINRLNTIILDPLLWHKKQCMGE